MVPRNGEPKKGGFSKSVVLLRRQHDFGGSGVPKKKEKHGKMRQRARGGKNMILGALFDEFRLLRGSLGDPRAEREGPENHQNPEKGDFGKLAKSCWRLGSSMIFEPRGSPEAKKSPFA